MIDGPRIERDVDVIESQIDLLLKKNEADYRLFSDATDGITESVVESSDRGESLFENEGRSDVLGLMGPVTVESRTGLEWSTFYPATPEGNQAFLDELQSGDVFNAVALMGAKPLGVQIYTDITATIPDDVSMEVLKATVSPALLRAEAIAPELFTHLQGVLNHSTIKQNRQGYYRTLTADSPALIALRTAYGIMGNCVRNDDRLLSQQMMYALPGGESQGQETTFDTSRVTDINTELNK